MENKLEIEIEAHALDCKIDALKAEIAEEYFDDDKLELLIEYSMKLGEVYAQRDFNKQLEGCVVVPVEPTDEWMTNYIDSGVENYCEQFIGKTYAVTEEEMPSIKEEWREPVRKAHALILKVVEAARGGK